MFRLLSINVFASAEKKLSGWFPTNRSMWTGHYSRNVSRSAAALWHQS